MALAPTLLLLLASAGPDAGASPTPRPVELPGEDGGSANAKSEEDAADAGPAEGIPGVTVSARIEPDPVPFGGRFELVVTVLRERGLHLELPATLAASEEVPQAGDARRSVEELAPPAGAASAGKSGATADAGPGPLDAGPALERVRETLRIPFLALALEDASTPAFVLAARDGATLEVPALPVRVADDPSLLRVAGPDGGVVVAPDGGVEDGAATLEPAAGVIRFKVADARPWWAAAAMASATLAFFAVRAVQKRRKLRLPPPPPLPLVPPRPPHEIALERLEALLGAGLLQRGETAVFVERLMDEVLRDYLAARFALHAEARTTRELVAELLSISMPGLDVKLVEELLGDADLVKFAKAAIAAERAHAMAMRVKMLVLATAPASAPGGAG